MLTCDRYKKGRSGSSPTWIRNILQDPAGLHLLGSRRCSRELSSGLQEGRVLYLALACSIVKGTLRTPPEGTPARPTYRPASRSAPAWAARGGRNARRSPGREPDPGSFLAGARPLPCFPELPVPPWRLAGSMGPRLLRPSSQIKQ